MRQGEIQLLPQRVARPYVIVDLDPTLFGEIFAGAHLTEHSSYSSRRGRERDRRHGRTLVASEKLPADFLSATPRRRTPARRRFLTAKRDRRREPFLRDGMAVHDRRATGDISALAFDDLYLIVIAILISLGFHGAMVYQYVRRTSPVSTISRMVEEIPLTGERRASELTKRTASFARSTA